MNLELLNNLEQSGKIRKETFSNDFFNNKYNSALERTKTAKMLLNNNYNDESVFKTAYSELYSSFRNLCEVALASCGYRVSNGKGHHEMAIATIQLTLDDEEIQPVYLRLQRICRKRDKMEYGGNFDISTGEMKMMLEDVELVLEKVKSEVDVIK